MIQKYCKVSKSNHHHHIHSAAKMHLRACGVPCLRLGIPTVCYIIIIVAIHSLLNMQCLECTIMKLIKYRQSQSKQYEFKNKYINNNMHSLRWEGTTYSNTPTKLQTTTRGIIVEEESCSAHSAIHDAVVLFVALCVCVSHHLHKSKHDDMWV